MKAFIFERPGEGDVVEILPGIVAANEVLIQVELCGVCGTDFHIWEGSEPSTHHVILGHEFAGTIKEIGANVKTVVPGDRVTVDPNIYCHSCEYCQAGQVNLCSNLKALGVDIHGGFAQFCVAPVTQLHLLPASMTWEEAALVEPLACALHGIERAEIKPGQSVMIVGAGPMGLLMTQLARLCGASKVMISEPVEWRRKVSLKLGVDQAYNPSIAPLQEQIPESQRPQIIIECAGHPKTQAESIQLVKRGGAVILFGDGRIDETFSVGSYDFYYKNLTVRGAALNPYTHTRAVKLLAEHRINIADLVTRRIPLDDLPTLLKQGKQPQDIKVLVSPNT